MSLNKKILEIICCPVSKVPLKPLSASGLKSVNEAITEGQCRFVDDTLLDSPLAEALITEDNKLIYPVDDGIPVLLAEKGIATLQIKNFKAD